MTIRTSFTAILTIASASILTACAVSPETQTSTLIADANVNGQTAIDTPVPETKGQDDSSDVAEDVVEDKEICKRQPVLGSRFNRSVCLKQSQWDALENDGRRTSRNIQRRGGAPGTTN